MICAEFIQTADGLVLASVGAAPADPSECEAIVLAGSDVDAVSALTFPDAANFAEAWALGFTLVVMSYCVSWGAGTVLRFIRS